MDLKESSDSLLSVTNVPFNAATQITLYTVPIGKICMVTKCIIVAGADCATTDITIGVTASWDNWCGANGLGGADFNLDELDAAGEYCVISPDKDTAAIAAASVLTRYTAGEVIKMDVQGGADGGATNAVYLFGILDDA